MTNYCTVLATVHVPLVHPLMAAKMAATIDVISEGRLIIGLGAGWNQAESDALGIYLPPLKERARESNAIAVRLLSKPVVGSRGAA